MNQKERKQIQLTAHYESLRLLAEHCGIKDADGKKLSNQLRKIEKEVEKPILDMCNGEFLGGEGLYQKILTDAHLKVQKLFANHLQGFFINTDPRGYALKIKDDVLRDVYSNTGLHRDWGGYGILAPEITGK